MPNVRNDDPDTSYAAAGAIAAKLGKLHDKILKAIFAAGGATPYELIVATGVIYNTVWRRLSELKKMGLVVNTTDRRPNDRGFNETVVVLTAKGAAKVGA